MRFDIMSKTHKTSIENSILNANLKIIFSKSFTKKDNDKIRSTIDKYNAKKHIKTSKQAKLKDEVQKLEGKIKELKNDDEIQKLKDKIKNINEKYSDDMILLNNINEECLIEKNDSIEIIDHQKIHSMMSDIVNSDNIDEIITNFERIKKRYIPSMLSSNAFSRIIGHILLNRKFGESFKSEKKYTDLPNKVAEKIAINELKNFIEKDLIKFYQYKKIMKVAFEDFQTLERDDISGDIQDKYCRICDDSSKTSIDIYRSLIIKLTDIIKQNQNLNDNDEIGDIRNSVITIVCFYFIRCDIFKRVPKNWKPEANNDN